MSSVERQRTAKETAIRSFLTKNSSLTRTQLAAVLSYIRGEHDSFDRDTRKLSGRKVSKGAFFRSLSQARRNIEGAVYTLALLVFEDVISQRDIDNITIIGDLLHELAQSSEVSEMGEIQQVLGKSEAMIARAIREMTSKRL